MYEDNGSNSYNNTNGANSGYDPYGRNPYGIVPEPNHALVTASMVLGGLSIATMAMMTAWLPFIFGGLAIIFAILSKGTSKQLNRTARIGLICAIVGIVSNIAVVGSSIYTVFTDKETYQEFNDTVEQMYGESFDDMLRDIQNGTESSL